MSQRIKKIEQELAKLESAIASMSQQLQLTYTCYLKVLGIAVQRQLITVVYQICTDIYPEIFLQFSLKQRIDLQAKVKQITQGIMAQLFTPVRDLEEIISGGREVEEVEEVKKSKKENKIRQLVNWQQHTEVEIGQLLQQSSQEVNNFLYQTRLLPQKLPIALLETATKLESRNATAVARRPNTINLVVELESNSSEGEEHDVPKELQPLTAIYLRLGDLEFNDLELGKLSNEVRDLVTKLHNLDREYHKQFKTYQVAQAQLAWRSTWVED